MYEEATTIDGRHRNILYVQSCYIIDMEALLTDRESILKYMKD